MRYYYFSYRGEFPVRFLPRTGFSGSNFSREPGIPRVVCYCGTNFSWLGDLGKSVKKFVIRHGDKIGDRWNRMADTKVGRFVGNTIGNLSATDDLSGKLLIPMWEAHKAGKLKERAIPILKDTAKELPKIAAKEAVTGIPACLLGGGTGFLALKGIACWPDIRRWGGHLWNKFRGSGPAALPAPVPPPSPDTAPETAPEVPAAPEDAGQ